MTARGPLRSWLYVPGHDWRKLERAAASEADVAILDLEDGTPQRLKREARAEVAAALAGLEFGATRRYVRINRAGSEHWRADIEATVGGRPDGYVIPKASSPEAVSAVGDAVRAAGAEGVALAPIVTEEPAGVFAAQATAAADPLVGAVLWGSEDLSAAIGARAVKDADGELLDVFRVVRALALLAGASTGRPVVDTPFLELRRPDELEREALAAARMGFAGKQAIHPDQVAPINAAFTPTEEEVSAARELVEAFDRDGVAVVRVDDAMADAPHLIRARRVLELAELASGERR